MSEKQPLNSLFRENPATPEGKYLVKRRDGTVVEWPHFVLGARDPNGADTLRFYGFLCLVDPDFRSFVIDNLRKMYGQWLKNEKRNKANDGFVASVLRFAESWDEYRAAHGDGDPLMGPHRRDDPATIAEMRKGMSA